MPRARYTLNTRTAVRHLMTYWQAASDSQREAGARWYPDARRQCQDMSDLFGFPLDLCAVVTSTLSPQTRWSDNIAFAFAVLEDGVRPAGCIGDNAARALDAIRMHYAGEDFFAVFGPRAHKTRRFAHAIVNAGVGDDVVIDVHMLRAILQGPSYVFRDGKGPDLAKVIKRVGVYEQCERAVRIAARRVGVSPCTFQAVVWLVVTENRGV